MKRLTWIASILAIAALGAVAQTPQTAAGSNKGLVECLAELTAEVRNLRLELLEQRLERQDQTITFLNGQIEKVKADQRQLEDRERSTAREVEEINERLRQAGMDQEERAQLEQLRTMAMTSGVASLAAEKSSFAQEETKIRAQLDQEQRRRQNLADTAQQLRGRARLH